MENWIILQDILVLLAACLLIGGLFSRFHQSPLVGYLIAGMLLGGPGSIRAVRSDHEIEAIAELGVALLLFSLGLEFSLNRLRKLGMKPLLAGCAQVSLTILLVFVGAQLFGLGLRESLALGAMCSLSSTAVVLRILSERAELDTPHGRLSLGVLLTQDMAVIPLALLMTFLGGQGGWSEIAWEVISLLFLAGLLLLALYAVTKVAGLALGQLTLFHNRELTVIFAVVMGLGAAWATHGIGVSPALGAFVAGMLLGSSPFATQIRADIAPLQVLLLTLFFGAAGMVADPLWILRNVHVVMLVVVLITVLKLLIVWAVFAVLGHSQRVSAATGLCLCQIGEFAFVLGSIGRGNHVVSEDLYSLVVSVAIVSFFLSAILVPRAASFGNAIARRFGADHVAEDRNVDETQAAEIVLIGFGPAAQRAAGPLIDQGIPTVVIDLNLEGVTKARNPGFRGEVGDATQPEVLKHAGLSTCRLAVVTVPHFRSAMTIAHLLRREAPQAKLLIRSRYDMHLGDFSEAGAHFVAGDESSVGERLGEIIAEQLRIAQEGEAAAVAG